MRKLKVIREPGIATTLMRRLRGEPVSFTHAQLVDNEWSSKNYYEPDWLGKGSSYPAVWVCTQGHMSIRPVCIKTRAIDSGSKFEGCPVCSGRIAPIRESLARKFPELANEWLRKENNGVPARWVASDSRRLATWRCAVDERHVFRAKVCARTSGINQGCPSCYTGTRVNLEANYPRILDLYDRTETNLGFDHRNLPEEFKVFWHCRINSQHVWYGSFAELRERNWQCPKCMREAKGKLCDYPILAKEFVFADERASDPTKIYPGSHTIVLWQCSAVREYRWTAPVYSRAIQGKGCPCCANKSVCSTNSLDNYSDVAKEFHPWLNGKATAKTVLASSSKKYWWLCSKCKHAWTAQARYRCQRGTGCPKCTGKVNAGKKVQYSAGLGQDSSSLRPCVLPAVGAHFDAEARVFWPACKEGGYDG